MHLRAGEGRAWVMPKIEIQIKRIPRRKGVVTWELWVMRRVFKVQEEWIDRGV